MSGNINELVRENEDLLGMQRPEDTLDSAEIVTKLDSKISQLKQGIICLDGGYGTGKTYILQELKERLENKAKGKPDSEKPVVVYFDAWKDDFHQGRISLNYGAVLHFD